MAKYVLSLDGGGVRGLATSVYLFELEKRLKKPLASKFDLVVGSKIVVDSSMIEEIVINNTTYNVILENYVVGVL